MEGITPNTNRFLYRLVMAENAVCHTDVHDERMGQRASDARWEAASFESGLRGVMRNW